MATSTRPALVNGSQASRSRSTITLKLAMAVSGVLFIAFVLVHMYGNLKAFSGQESFNGYAEHLRELGEPILPHEGFLWISRAGLLLALVVHVVAAVILARRKVGARSTQYVTRKYKHSSISSRTMRWGGLTLLLFIVWHLLNFSFGKINVSNGNTGDAAGDPYSLMVDSFGVWWLTVIYLVSMVALALHLHHGTFSATQTLGYTNTAKARRNAKAAGLVLAIVVAGGYSLVPLGVLTGIID